MNFHYTKGRESGRDFAEGRKAMLKILYILGNKNTENPIGFSLLNNPENFMKNLGKPS